MNYRALADQLFSCITSPERPALWSELGAFVQGEIGLLFYLRARGGQATPGEISKSLKISTGRVAAALNSLERKGLVRREIDSGDRRKVIVSLTETGARNIEEKREKQLTELEKALSKFSEEDAREFIRLVQCAVQRGADGAAPGAGEKHAS